MLAGWQYVLPEWMYIKESFLSVGVMSIFYLLYIATNDSPSSLLNIHIRGIELSVNETVRTCSNEHTSDKFRVKKETEALV